MRINELNVLAALATAIALLMPAVASSQMQSPAPGAQLEETSVTFNWASVPGAAEYRLAVGTSAAAVEDPPYADLYFRNTTGTSVTVPVIPLDGGQLHVRLWWRVGVGWDHADYVYPTLAAVPAELIAPDPALPLAADAVTFRWTPGVAVDRYTLVVASARHLLESGEQADIYGFVGSAVETTVTRLPTDGSPVHVRLWSQIGLQWLYRDYTYQASALVPAALVSPAPGTTLTEPVVAFEWTESNPPGVYALGVSTTEEGLSRWPWGDVFFELPDTGTRSIIGHLPEDGQPLHVRLWSFVGGELKWQGYSFVSAYSPDAPVPMDACRAKGWQEEWIEAGGQSRRVLWAEPDGRWQRGALVVFHSGGGSATDWCSAIGTGDRIGHAMNDFAQTALAQGYAVFALDSTLDKVVGEYELTCGKRFDFAVTERPNLDLPAVSRLLYQFIPLRRPWGSDRNVFMTGHSTGGFMATRAATHFDELVTGFAAVAGGDPYGTSLWCDPELFDRELAPGATFDRETQLAQSVPDACVSATYESEAPWESMNPPQKPSFLLLHNEHDPIVDLSCMDKTQALLQVHGYFGAPAFISREEFPVDLTHHLWQPEYSQAILDFFETLR